MGFQVSCQGPASAQLIIQILIPYTGSLSLPLLLPFIPDCQADKLKFIVRPACVVSWSARAHMLNRDLVLELPGFQSFKDDSLGSKRTCFAMQRGVQALSACALIPISLDPCDDFIW